MGAIGTLVIGGVSIPKTTKGDESDTQRFLSNPLDVLTVDYSKEAIKGAIVYISQQYSLNEKQVNAVIQCESQYDPYAVGDKGLAYGIAQFHEATFKEYCSGSYYSPVDQLVCLAKMWKLRQQAQWGCYNRIFK